MRNIEKPIFILGIPRCGSTLWAKVLEKSRKLERIREIRFYDPWQNDFKTFIKRNKINFLLKEDVKKLINIIFSRNHRPVCYGGFWFELKKIDNIKLKENVYYRLLNSKNDLDNVFKVLVEEYIKIKEKNRFYIKFPMHLSYIPTLKKMYPDCKIVHITRDPRAIAVSKTNDPKGTHKLLKKYPSLKFFIKKIMILFVVIQYIWSSKIHQKYRSLSNYELFRFEDLIYKPEKTIRNLCDFLEIDFTKEMLYPNGETPSSLTRKTQSGFDKKAPYRWKEEISLIEKILIDLLIKKSMKRLNYKSI